ncbi:MAG: hypothetical protein DRH93_17960 [Deltaproteobacteria bacterium]|nr:MAG: hypothetical protein DRH93_17960 [Deltaproteobacteria bacterium]
MIYKDEYHPQVKKDLKKLSPKLRQIVREEHISAILLNPDKGKPLAGDLNGVFSYHFN